MGSTFSLRFVFVARLSSLVYFPTFSVLFVAVNYTTKESVYYMQSRQQWRSKCICFLSITCDLCVISCFRRHLSSRTDNSVFMAVLRADFLWLDIGEMLYRINVIHHLECVKSQHFKTAGTNLTMKCENRPAVPSLCQM